MNRDKAVGIALLAISIAIIIAYTYIMFAAPYAIAIFLLKLTDVVAVAVVFGILAWVGYALATTPPPKPIEEIEKEIEEELKKLEQETKQQGQTQTKQ